MTEKNNIEKSIRKRYTVIAIVMLIVAFAIPLFALHTMLTPQKELEKISKRYEPNPVQIEAPRGNILACNGAMMATSDKLYRLHIDFWAEGINGDTLKKYVRPLAVELNALLPSRTAAQYEATIMNGWNLRKKQEKDIAAGKTVKKERDYRLDIPEINYLDLKKIEKMPWFRLGRNKTGLKSGDSYRVIRSNPYGTLALRTIGSIYGDISQNRSGKNGLELGYDSILSGRPGKALQTLIERRIITKTEKEAIPGYDIVSTIDVNIQDITERALKEKLQALDAESGTAVVMETSTGEVKAITNMGRVAEGVWNESQNFALTDLSSPGSTFKVVSMMVMLDDGLVKPDDVVDTGNGSYTIPGSGYTVTDARRGGGKFTAAQTIKYSSNIGVGKLTTRAYGRQPEKYVDGIRRIGLDQDMKLEIPGYAVSRIPHPQDKNRYWSGTDLFTMSYGYVTGIPPIYTLTFFNAIANNGRMMKPHFVREILEKGNIREKKKPETLNPAICTRQTLGHIRSMLDSVVNAPDGTGKPVRSDIVRIAGKTGTAQLQDGRGGHQVSFCGYFPSDNPKYSCIVVIRRPRNGNASGGYMSGTVFKRIAEEISGLATVDNTKNIAEAVDTVKPKLPRVKSGHYNNIKSVLEKLKLQHDIKSTGEWVTSKTIPDRNLIETTARRTPENHVPDVTGMGARDAVYTLETAGLRVTLDGRGTVFSQSPAAGTKAIHGQTAVIHLQ